MNLNWLTTPLAFYGAIAIGLAAVLELFVSVKMEIAAGQRRGRDAVQALGRRIEELEAALSRVREESQPMLQLPAPAGTTLNLTKRVQALRMQRRGEAPATIAATLRTARNEIELLLKLHQSVETVTAGRAVRTGFRLPPAAPADRSERVAASSGA